MGGVCHFYKKSSHCISSMLLLYSRWNRVGEMHCRCRCERKLPFSSSSQRRKMMDQSFYLLNLHSVGELEGMNEAATCREYVRPRLEAAGWDDEVHPILEQKTFTDGRIVPLKRNKVKRLQPRRADYLLHYTRDFPLAVVEAKPDYKLPADGLQQAKNYAEILGLKFAYATNGHGIVEYDYFTGIERELDAFPTPAELWARLRSGQGLDDDIAKKLLTPSYIGSKQPRYYQQIAIDETLQAILKCQKRILLTMATGTGKTMVAFQICWKLWNARWNVPGQYRRPRILYLSDRNILVDDPRLKEFAAFDKESVYKIENGQIRTSCK